MSAASLSSRAIIGEFYNTLEQNTGALWVPGTSMLVTSDQESETYKWLGMAPAMREWVGGRVAKAVSYTHLRAHETPEHLVCRLLLEKKNEK